MLAGMTNPREARRGISAITWFGLFIAIFGMLIARQVVSYFLPSMTFASSLWKELLMWLLVVLLFFIIRRGERLPFRSVGLGTSVWWKSFLWGLVIALVCFLLAGLLVALTHFNGGPLGKAFEKLPLWLITLIVLRAGVVEELFYRGYAIERLEALGLNRYWAAAIPLVIFAFGHWTNGWANILIALVLGAVLCAFYLWRRDLVSNMIGHFLVDFVANVVPRLFS
jgi:CAAX protease family protein